MLGKPWKKRKSKGFLEKLNWLREMSKPWWIQLQTRIQFSLGLCQNVYKFRIKNLLEYDWPKMFMIFPSLLSLQMWNTVWITCKMITKKLKKYWRSLEICSWKVKSMKNKDTVDNIAYFRDKMGTNWLSLNSGYLHVVTKHIY